MMKFLRFSLFLFTTLCLLFFGCSEPEVVEVKEVVAPRVIIPKTKLTLLHKMQGRWLDSKVPEAVIEVLGDRMLWVYQEDVMMEKKIKTFDDLPKICRTKPTRNGLGFFVAYNGDDGYCYQVISLEDNVFNYVPLSPAQ